VTKLQKSHLVSMSRQLWLCNEYPKTQHVLRIAKVDLKNSSLHIKPPQTVSFYRQILRLNSLIDTAIEL